MSGDPTFVGKVVSGRPTVCIEFLVRGGGEMQVPTILDTGFDGDIALPNEKFRLLRSTPLVGGRRIIFGDGRVKTLPACVAKIRINGEPRDVTVFDLGESKNCDPPRAFVGSGLFSNCRITIDLKPDGKVVVEPLGRSH